MMLPRLKNGIGTGPRLACRLVPNAQHGRRCVRTGISPISAGFRSRSIAEGWSSTCATSSGVTARCVVHFGAATQLPSNTATPITRETPAVRARWWSGQTARSEPAPRSTRVPNLSIPASSPPPRAACLQSILAAVRQPEAGLALVTADVGFLCVGGLLAGIVAAAARTLERERLRVPQQGGGLLPDLRHDVQRELRDRIDPAQAGDDGGPDLPETQP